MTPDQLYKQHKAKHGDSAVSRGSFRSRLATGWTEQEAVDTPIQRPSYSGGKRAAAPGELIDRTLEELWREVSG